MDAAAFLDLAIFLVAAFAAALVTGLAGFAFGIVVAGPWLHVLTPGQCTTLIMLFGLLIQGYSVWKLRASIRPRRLAPLLIGSAIGAPLGVASLRLVDPAHMRAATGAVLILYAAHSLMRPKLPELKTGPRADAMVGILGGVLGGATGLAGIVVTIWSGLRGWPKDEQRAVFQPTGLATFAMIALWLGGTGTIDRTIVIWFVCGLPVILAGTWLGLKLYGRLDEAAFRRVVLGLLLVSGASLLA